MATMYSRSPTRRRGPFLSLVLGGGVLLAGTGCAGRQQALEKELAALQEEVTRLQGDQDRAADRLAAVELRIAHDTPLPVSSAGSERPLLEVVHLGPSSEQSLPSAAEPAVPREVIEAQSSVVIAGQGTDVSALPAASPSKKAVKRGAN